MRDSPTAVPTFLEDNPGSLVHLKLQISTRRERICASRDVERPSWYAPDEEGPVGRDDRISGFTDIGAEYAKAKRKLRTSMRMSMGMLMSWESRPILGFLRVHFVRGSRRPAVLVALAHFRCDVRVVALVICFPSTAVLVLAVEDMDHWMS